MAVDAPHRMYVMRAFTVGERGVHLRYIELAVRDGGMTIFAALF